MQFFELATQAFERHRPTFGKLRLEHGSVKQLRRTFSRQLSGAIRRDDTTPVLRRNRRRLKLRNPTLAELDEVGLSGRIESECRALGVVDDAEVLEVGRDRHS